MTFIPKDVCSKKISVVLDGEIIKEVGILGGCHGNTQGIIRLAEGRSAKEVISLLEGLRCGEKTTSCPDQLAKALKEALQAK